MLTSKNIRQSRTRNYIFNFRFKEKGVDVLFFSILPPEYNNLEKIII